MRYIIFFIFIIAATNEVPAQLTGSDGIIGTWLTADGTGEITIFKDGESYYGRITAGTSDQKFDVQNPDKARRNDPLIGLVILKDLKYEGDGEWKNGTVYDPQNGKRYSCNLELSNRNTLKITGYIGFSWIGRSEVWTRITSNTSR